MTRFATSQRRTSIRTVRWYFQFAMSFALACVTSQAIVCGAASGDRLFSNANLRAELDDQNPTVAASFAGEQSVRPGEAIELVLSRALKDSEERIAVLIGTTDVTSLFRPEKLRLRYNARLWPLPLGESQVAVYLVSKDDYWREIARFVLKVGRWRRPVSCSFVAQGAGRRNGHAVESHFL